MPSALSSAEEATRRLGRKEVSGTEMVREGRPSAVSLDLKGEGRQLFQSIIGATLKRLDTAEPVFTWGVAEFCTIFVYVF